MSARVSGSCAPPRMCGWRSSMTRPSWSTHADMAGERVRIWIVRIDDVPHLAGEREHGRVFHRGIRERIQPDIAVYESRGDAIGLRELAGIAVGRPLLVGERFPQAMHRALANLADHLLDLARLDAARREPARAVDIGMGHGPARVWLERQCLGHPALAEIACQRARSRLASYWRSRGRSRACLRTRCAGRGSRASPAAPRAGPLAPPSRDAGAWSRRHRRDIR